MTSDAEITETANAEQTTYWNDVGGPKWVRYADMLDLQLNGIGQDVIDAVRPGAGQTVLDVGCGSGSTTLALGRLVGPFGRATGIDLSRPMLELARQRAEAASMPQVTFEEADAQTHHFERRYDFLFSRFGVMFFDDPVRAFTNLHTALRPKGRMAFVCWQSLPYNPWMAVPMMAALKHITMQTPPSPDAPGPFSFADKNRVKSILSDAGFQSVSVVGHEVSLTIGGGGDAAAATDFLLDMGPLARALPDVDTAVRQAITRDVFESLSDYAGADGVRMPGAVWIVTAEA